MLHVTRVLRSRIQAVPRIIRLDAVPARMLFQALACIVADRRPARQVISGGSVRHRLLFAMGIVRCIGEPIAAVAAIDEATAARGSGADRHRV